MKRHSKGSTPRPARGFPVVLLGLMILGAPAAAQHGNAEPVAVVNHPQLADAFPYVSADGRYLFFSRQQQGRGWGNQTMMVSVRTGDGWGEPGALPFSGGPHSDRAPRLSIDGRRLVFSSNRPWPGESSHEGNDFDIWIVDREGEHGWGTPRPLSRQVNSTSPDIHPVFTEDGTLYFASSRPGGQGRSDIYRTRPRGGGYRPVESVGGAINTEFSEPDLWVASDGSRMIFASTDRPGGMGGDDLYVSVREGSGWSAPRLLEGGVNTSEYEYGPSVTTDGWLYFTSHRGGGGDVYRVRMQDAN